MRILRKILWLGVAVLLAALAYGWTGYRDARAAGPDLAARAEGLIADGRSGIALGQDRRALLLAVEDPAFGIHAGFDLTTPGAGNTTITQSLPKPEGFADFSPGLKKLRQIGYAIGLERSLTKQQILALFLDSVPMGRNAPGPDAQWVNGIYAASQAHFDAQPEAVSDEAFVSLIAVMIAPGDLSLAAPDDDLAERVRRIMALGAGDCAPLGHDDVWLAGCDTAN